MNPPPPPPPRNSSLSLRLPYSSAVLDLWNTRWLTEENNGQHQWVGPVNEGCSAVDPCSYRHSGQWNRRSVGKGRPKKKDQPSSHLSYKETRTLIRNRQTSTFIASIGGYNPQKDPLHQLSRHEQTTIFRLRTGHCGLKGHLKKKWYLALGSMWLWERWSNTKSFPAVMSSLHQREATHLAC